MNQTLQTARIGLFFILGLAFIWVTYATLGGHLFEASGYVITASFDDLNQLKASDEVRMAGVKVGTVETTQLVGRKAQAVLRIQPGIKISNDATATIAMAGLLGTDFVSIDLGTAGAPSLAPGSAIRTQPSPDLNSLISQLSGLGDKLNSALGSFGSAFNGKGPQGGLFQHLDQLVTQNQQDVRATVSNLKDITGKIDRGEGTVGRLVNDPALYNQMMTTVSDLRSSAANIRSVVVDAKGVIDQVKSGQGALGVLLYDPTTAQNIKVTLQNVRNVSDKIARGDGSLGKLLNDNGLYDEAETTLKKADRTLDTMNDSGPITAVGIVANSLF